MGGFNPISTLLGTARSLTSSDSALDSYKQARALYEQQEKEIRNSTAMQKKQLDLEAEKTNTDRRNALKRAMAKQQAVFGGQGIDSTDGSGEAVLLGLLQENEEDKTYRDRLDRLKRQALATETDNKRARNLLTLQNQYLGAQNALARNDIGLLGAFK